MPEPRKLERTVVAPARAWVVVAAVTLIAWRVRFIQDDAFISFRYAWNWVNGHGLVWNPGERVEGYTNFLWTAAMAVPHASGIDPVSFSYALGLICFALTLFTAFAITRRWVGSSGWALLAIVLLGTNYSFLAYATGGLETQLQALLVTAAMGLAFRAIDDSRWPSVSALGMLSTLAALALLTRMDSSVLLVLPCMAVAWRVLRRTDEGKLPRLLALFVPGLAIVGAWLYWRVGYYGDLLPNTYYAKMGGWKLLRPGALYLFSFLSSYALLPIALLTAVVLARDHRLAPRGFLLAAVSIAVWCLYVMRVGGDFMEYRFLIPALPIGFVLIVWALRSGVESRLLRLVLVAALPFASLAHAVTFPGVAEIESVRQLGSHLKTDGDRWIDAGVALGRWFKPTDGVVIATSAAGAIPYFARLETVDMLGLNDRWIARNGLRVGTRVGHQRLATLNYLIQRRVNLVIGQPWIVPSDATFESHGVVQDVSSFRIEDATPEAVPITARILEIPIDARSNLRVLYLISSPAVESAILKSRLRSYPIRRK